MNSQNPTDRQLNTGERFANIDFLRFLFAVSIVLFHGRFISEGFLPELRHCNVCVDFFFIMAGFFLINSVKRESTTAFIKKRFFRLAPVLWFMVFSSLITSIFINNMHYNINDHILRLFFLSDIGLEPGRKGGVGVTWFVSALFWVSLFYFYLYKIFEKKYLNMIIGIITFFSLVFYLNYRNFDTGWHTLVIMKIIDIGVLRAITGLGIGYFISLIYKSGFLKTVSIKSKIIISILEIYTSLFLIYYLFLTPKLPAKTGMMYYFMFTVLFYLFLIKQGVLSNLLNTKISTILGQYSYSIYMMHPLVFAILVGTIYQTHSVFIKEHLIFMYILQTIAAVIVGAVIYYLVEKPAYHYLKNRVSADYNQPMEIKEWQK